tara:strand:+ start:316 stop:768 length:453 start_codon:yes stop_codon:yes gene_type:complete
MNPIRLEDLSPEAQEVVKEIQVFTMLFIQGMKTEDDIDTLFAKWDSKEDVVRREVAEVVQSSVVGVLGFVIENATEEELSLMEMTLPQDMSFDRKLYAKAVDILGEEVDPKMKSLSDIYNAKVPREKSPETAKVALAAMKRVFRSGGYKF